MGKGAKKSSKKPVKKSSKMMMDKHEMKEMKKGMK